MNISPINYNLEFTPDLKKLTFIGKEAIEINCKKPTNSIVLNSVDLDIKKCSLNVRGKNIVSKIKLDVKKQELQIKLSSKIMGKQTLSILFSGKLLKEMKGFYYSKYKIKSKEKFLATTQFEPGDARRAFPCWDEPIAKATFEISIIADSTFMAISNTKETTSKKIGKKILHKFAKTPRMSTYLVYLGVGELEYIKKKIGKITLRVITTKGNKEKGKYALDISGKLLLEYEKYFGIKYPLEKLDLIAIPDFSAGAMENWGAITFREVLLLYDPKTSSTKTKQDIAIVTSHEIAHQWFGNLVTMDWWNGLWLNESFATLMEYKFVHKLYPEWDVWDQFVEAATNSAMIVDALKSSRPIDIPVKELSDVEEIFDLITYEKGGSVLRMLEDYVSEKKFRTGLINYLKDFKYKNAKGDDLWDAISKSSGEPVSQMMTTWIKQMGFPLVDVTQNDSHIQIKQGRFLTEKSKKSYKDKWYIPISVGREKEFTKKLVSRYSDSIPKHKNDFGFVINFGRKGFYRVKYDKSTLEELRYLVVEKKIPYLDRWGIQNDLYALCSSGEESIGTYLEFSDAYIFEDNYTALQNVATNLNSLYWKTFGEPFSYKIHWYAERFLKNTFKQIGWEPKKNEKHTASLLRPFLIVALGKLGNKEILQESHKRFQKFLKNNSSLAADLREPVFILTAWEGNFRTYKLMKDLYLNAKDQEEKMRFLSALCSFKDPNYLRKTLFFLLTEHVRAQDLARPIARISSNPYAKKIVWPWIKKNWNNIFAKSGEGAITKNIVASISYSTDASKEKEVVSFFKHKKTPGITRTLKQTAEKMRINSQFLKNARKEFNNY